MDLDDALDGPPFAVRDLWRASAFSKEDRVGSLFPPVELDLSKIKIDNPYAPVKSLEHDLRLPDLETFEFGPLEDLHASEPSVISSIDEPPSGEFEVDPWSLDPELQPLRNEVRYFSWEGFKSETHQEPRSIYIGESPTTVFDAAVTSNAEKMGKQVPKQVFSQAEVLLKSLFLLGLGRASVVYPNSTTKRIPERFRISGCSSGLSHEIQRQFQKSGIAFQKLRRYVEWTFSSQTFPAQVALGSVFSTVLSALEDHLCSALPEARSLIHLQQTFAKAEATLLAMERLLASIKKAQNNEELVTLLYQQVQHMEYEGNHLRPILTEVLQRVCEPWLAVVAEWTGLKTPLLGVKTNTQEARFVTATPIPDEQRSGPEDYEYDYQPNGMPAFIPEEDGEMIFETGKALRFLKSHHPHHPLSNPQRYGVAPPALQWQFCWQDMDAVLDKAKHYEKDILKAIREFRSQGSPTKSSTSLLASNDNGVASGENLGDPETFIRTTAELFDSMPTDSYNLEEDSLHRLVASSVSSEPESSDNMILFPPLATTPQLSLIPLLRTQSRLVAATSSSLFIRAHNLRHHLQLHSSFHLLTDGVFIARLTPALLDPTASSVERQRGVMRTGERLGLKLGSRDTWPPASSELRLALAGMLDECYWDSFPYGATSRIRYDESLVPYLDTRILVQEPQTPRRQAQQKHLAHLGQDQHSLPGSLSFAIRGLPAVEIEKCMDPNSLQALDFLRLQYSPPSPLNVVITPQALEKFDKIFKFLLRLLRVRWVVDRLNWTAFSEHRGEGRSGSKDQGGVAHRFRIESRHFVQTCAGYFFDTGVREIWRDFERWLDHVEAELAAEDAMLDAGEKSTVESAIGIDTLRSRLDQTLDRILWCLLLRHRQAKILAVLEDVLSGILAFAKIDGNESAEIDFQDVAELYSKFRNNIALFLTVCRGLAAKRGYGSGSQSKGEENTIERLVVSLEMNGYYADLAGVLGGGGGRLPPITA